MKYEYTISMVWHSEESNSNTDKFTISPELINGFAIISDYKATNMPIAYATLTLNKTERDKIIKNAKTAYFDVTVSGIDIDSGIQANSNTKYTGKCVYFIDEDINYNKELDYPEKTKATALKANNDVLQTFSIGLMWDNCIERNKKTSNDTIIKTTMFNAVMKQCQNTPILVEPFKYNETIDQLILTPKDSLAKAISFFNDIKVFYDTKYRFFIDPDCSYLVSSSGNPTKKKGEKYDTWLFNVKPITDPASMKEGFEYNDKQKCYYADVHVKDTYYTIDNDTNKLFNELKAIIDPDTNNTPPLLKSVNNAISAVQKLTDQINSVLKNDIGKIEIIPSKLSNYKSNFIEDAQKINLEIEGTDGNPGRAITKEEYTIRTLSDAWNELDKLKDKPPMSDGGESGTPEPTVDPDKWYNDIVDLMNDISTASDNISNCNANSIQTAPETFKSKSKDVNKMLTGVTNIPGYVNCVTPINSNDNVGNMLKKTEDLKKQNIIIINEASEFKTNLTDAAEVIRTNYNNAYTALNTAIEKWDASNPTTTDEQGNTQSPKDDNGNELTNPFPTYRDNIENDRYNVLKYIGVSNNGTIIQVEEDSNIKPMVYMCQSYASLCDTPRKTIEIIGPTIQKIKINSTNIKSSVLGAWNAIQNIGISAKKSLEKITQLSNEISNKVKSLDFNIKSLPDLKKNINIVKDISSIGKLGISAFSVDLGIAMGGKTTGQKIIKVKNDNNNK